MPPPPVFGRVPESPLKITIQNNAGNEVSFSSSSSSSAAASFAASASRDLSVGGMEAVWTLGTKAPKASPKAESSVIRAPLAIPKVQSSADPQSESAAPVFEA